MFGFIFGLATDQCLVQGNPYICFSFNDLAKVHSFVSVSETKRKAIQAIIMMACTCIWCVINDAIFSNASVKVDKIIREIKGLSFLWINNSD